MNENLRILIVDDEPNSTNLMKKVLEKKGYSADTENISSKAKELIESGEYDLVISDLQMPEVSGLDLLKVKPDNCHFIMVTGYGSVDSAVESMKQGAFDYIMKPFNIEEFAIKVKKAADNLNISKQLIELRAQVESSNSFSNIVGKSRKMMNVFELIKNVARSDINVLIEGYSGTGKELAARAIHQQSARKNGPFIAINCSAIPDNLLESELFGHTKGAFTGAVDSQRGVFEQANGGTLLLDEIADMPFHLQSKLLRVIENWEIKPLGSDKVKKFDVRLISSTNQNLRELITQKKFRDDLFYRISSVTITLPPLNERKDDIVPLSEHILKKLSAKLDRQLSLDSGAIQTLMRHDWNGNVRELENVIERAAITSLSDNLTKNEFRFITDGDNPDSSIDGFETAHGLKDLEKLYITKVLAENGWNKMKAAQNLGIDRKTLYKKIREYGLE
ncbi:MAG: sigma-54-dependent Fis family transcriptional regulator [Ignavibacteria bacterium]|nr:sigma-54-dependent Fis family transcriptional regulator [Ignavibacteria bacterium]MBK6878780.1 sigma-54-dependent Fis family transcriptional regulator [Ignavibacteria bacterium]